jgi:hypothetical protein
MRYSAFWIVPLAIVAPVTAQATVYFTVAQAQAQMFPGATFTPASREMTDEQMSAIRHDSGQTPLSKELKAWRVSGGGWFIVDEVVGKHEFITYALALDATGAVKDVEIMEYRETYGGDVRNADWRAQFVGKRHGATLQLGEDIKNISGATLSSKHITDGVRRLLATYAIVLSHG